MKKLRVYLETTMFNYYFDNARDGHLETVRLFESIGAGILDGFTSRYVTYELLMSPEPKQSDMLALIEKFKIKMLEIDEESDYLSNVYIRERIIPAKYSLDCAHIASASVNNLDCVLSFNFQHINRLKTKEMTALVNLREGYKSIIICTPMEVIDYEEQ